MLRVSAALIGATLLSACAPPQQRIFLKEHDTEHNAVPRPAARVDRFSFGRAMGTVDVAFVVDNTDFAEAGKEAFEKSYRSFLSGLTKPEQRLLNFRVQLVTTPGLAAPSDWAGTGVDATLQLQEFFTGKPDQTPPYFNLKDWGAPDPMASSARVIQSKAFEGRQSGPLYLVYFLGNDINPVDPGVDKGARDYISKRGPFQTHLWALTRTSESIDKQRSFPFCNSFAPAPKAIAYLSSLQTRSLVQKDLCDRGWSGFSDDLLRSIVVFKKRLVLSQVPYQPETMALRNGAQHLYRYGEDYKIDLSTNEILFLKDPGLQEADLLEATYYLEPTEEVFSGSPNPPQAPNLPIALPSGSPGIPR
ncbi:MAG: hypothetical protein ACXWPM_03810 [Bdellovibrionota bacterium]